MIWIVLLQPNPSDAVLGACGSGRRFVGKKETERMYICFFTNPPDSNPLSMSALDLFHLDLEAWDLQRRTRDTVSGHSDNLFNFHRDSNMLIVH